MAGIYIHIPYCKKACHYCDFHFSTTLKTRKDMISALCTEIKLRKDEINSNIETIYFGGGTPSILNNDEFELLFTSLSKHFNLDNLKECTIECNPDDITDQKLDVLKKFPFNRLSIGIQTFRSDVLRTLNRTHNGEEALNSIKLAQRHGFSNITCDLIYGIPYISNQEFLQDIKTLLALKVPHISAYCLTVEDKTALKKMIEAKQIPSLKEQDAIHQYELLQDTLDKAGIKQYEISNFAKEGNEAIHNTNYWKGVEYLGIGPSAHSYNGKQRSFTIRNNSQYIKSILSENLLITREHLTRTDKVNDYILTRLRTAWGINLSELRSLYQYELSTSKQTELTRSVKKGWVDVTPTSIKLTKEGTLMADEIAMDFFI